MMEQVEQYIRTGGRDSDARRASLEWLVMTKPWTLAQAEDWLDAMVRTFNPHRPVTADELRDALGIGDTPDEALAKLVAAMSDALPWWVWAVLFRMEAGLAWLQRRAFIGWVWLTQRPAEPEPFNEQFQMTQADVDALWGIWERAGDKRITYALMVMNVRGRR